MSPARTVIAGVGSEYRRDDGAGVAVAAEVAARQAGTVDVGPVGEPLDLLGRWDGADLAVVVDAVRSGAPPGTVSVVEVGPDGAAAEAAPGTSTHGIGLVGTYRLARATGSAPRRLVLVCVEGADFGDGCGLSPAVATAVPEAARAVIELVRGGVPCA